MAEISATIKAKVTIVCPICSEVIEVKIEGLSSYESPEEETNE